jgi:formylglycine-generating enzyme required for sulfatase activity
VWLFLDGFDEVSGERVAELRDRIATLANTSACAASIVVTARPYALPDFAAASPRLAPGTFGIATIQPLSEPSQRDLLTKWLGADRAAAVFAELQARELLADLCRNPLTLTWLALLLRVPGATPPRSRVDLYDRVVRVYLEDTPAVGGDDKPEKVKAPTDARPILASLALALQEAALDGETWTREQLVDALWQIDETHTRGRVVKLWGSPDGFLDQVAARCGLLAEFDGAGEGWRFLHRSVREYLVAEALLKRESREQWLARAKALSDKTFPRWAEPFALLCPRVPDAGAFILALGDHNSALALRCLPEIDVPFAAAFGVLQQLQDWDGDDLLALVQGALRGGELPAAIEAVLWPLVTPKQSLDMLAYMHFAMSSVGIAVDRGRFFGACGRPIDGAPSIDFVSIPAGSFMMGSPEDEAKRTDAEGPVHQVTLRAFAVAKTVVTNADYRRFDSEYEPRKWAGVNPKQLNSHPAVRVSWWHAYLFCAWIGARLPSESEWEYACRAGTKTPFSFGDTISTEQVNYNGNHPYGDGEKGEYRRRTVPVASLPANPWGLFQMHGNVDEWCADRWHDNYEDAPNDGAAWVIRGARYRVLRGGSWSGRAGGCRSAYRYGWPASARSDSVGFRPARFTTK